MIPDIFRDGPLEIRFGEHLVFVHGVEVELRPIEWRLLVILVRERPNVVSFRVLRREAWIHSGPREGTDQDLVKWHMGYVIRKLGTDNIQAVPGFGYKYVPIAREFRIFD